MNNLTPAALRRAATLLTGPKHPTWDTPGQLAQALDPRTKQTPALKLIDQHLVDAYNTPDSRLIISMPPQEGKLVADNTPVPTPDGWKNHGDLQPGDYVFHPSGTPVKVLEVHAPAKATLRVHFTDHSSVVVHPRHEWTLHDCTAGKFRTVETQDLGRLTYGPIGKRGARNRWKLPHREPLDLPDRDLPIDPYTLGAWLGDGSSTKACITHHADDVIPVAYPTSAEFVHKDTGVVTTYYRGGLRTQLRLAGLLGNKHIPAEYLRASERQRRELLAGLIDTDGHAGRTGQHSFDNANEQLVRQVAELIRTLGYRAHVHRPTPAKLSTSGIQGVQEMWRVTYTPHDMLSAKLQRKRTGRLARVRRRVAICKVEEVAPETGRCITVGSPDGLYLVGENMLPTHNSQRASRRFPLWALTQNPDLRIAMASYESRIAERWGRTVRDDIKQNPHLGLTIRDDVSAQREWQLEDHDGGMFATGVGGAMTGRPVDCVRGDMLIECEYGKISAEEAYSRNINWIRAYDHGSGQVVWSRVEASRRIDGRKVIEVRTSDNRVLVCTPDHRVYTERGYVPAGRLRHGETLLGLMDGHGMPMREYLPEAEDGHPESDPTRAEAVLLDGLHPDGNRGISSDASVRCMRGADRQKSGENMLREVLSGSAEDAAHYAGVPGVRNGRPNEEQQDSVLLQGLRERSSLEANDRQRELALQDRQKLRELVSPDAPHDSRSRRAQMRRVRGVTYEDLHMAREDHHAVSASDTSPQREALGQQRGELDHTVLQVPRNTPQVRGVTVSMVRELGDREVSVYDFQVEGTSNFFAGDVLVHNCLLIDDPIKGREQADSATIREKTWEWWTDTALSRLAPGAPVILILTRWHSDDLAGRLIAETDSAWTFLNIPAQADHKPEQGETDVLGREPGEFMISARGRTTEQWEDRKLRSGPKTWAALYQGRPSPEEGGIFPPADQWARYTQPIWTEAHDGTRRVPGIHRGDHELIQSWDLTFKDTKGSDYVVGQVWLRVGAEAYLLDQTRARLNFTATVDAIKRMTARWPEATAKLIEDKANGPAVINHLRQTVAGLIPVEPEGSKHARASAVSPFVFANNIHLPDSQLLPGVDDLLEEAKSFPNSPHDDTIDAMSQALSYLLLHRLPDTTTVVPDEYDLADTRGWTISPY